MTTELFSDAQWFTLYNLQKVSFFSSMTIFGIVLLAIVFYHFGVAIVISSTIAAVICGIE